MFLLARFILQNLKKTLRADQCYEDVSFSTPKWPIYPEQNFYFHLPIGPFHCAKFKKILIRMHHFWAQNRPFSLNNFFLENY